MGSESALLNWALRDPATQTIHELATKPVYAAGSVVMDAPSVSRVWKEKLVQSADCAMLRDVNTVPASHHWLRNPDRLFPNVFIKAIQLRSGTLQTKARTARHKPMTQDEIGCRGACNCPENISHILQTCSVTDLSRHRRHNDICNEIIRRCRKQHTTIIAEPHVPTASSYLKPDLVIIRDDQAYILDVAVCGVDRLEKTYRLKEEKYGNTNASAAISAHLSRLTNTPLTQIHQQPIIFNNRGHINIRSSHHLKAHGFNNRDIADLCMTTIHGSIRTYNNYMRGAFRTTERQYGTLMGNR
ncbi:unnamed protein product [Echinostoma caproni]|uniref:Retrovirus-related Pol polyprotein from type-2 retrotransposable element R2DM n=1 Tax=Echinostoma caproni TaxID=27848 RepID=A0A183A4V3_9TREM|nr:unnamed protein product [Echinostoma caproni]